MTTRSQVWRAEHIIQLRICNWFPTRAILGPVRRTILLLLTLYSMPREDKTRYDTQRANHNTLSQVVYFLELPLSCILSGAPRAWVSLHHCIW